MTVVKLCIIFVLKYMGDVGGMVASWLVRSTLSPGWGHSVVLLGKTLYSHSASLHPGV